MPAVGLEGPAVQSSSGEGDSAMAVPILDTHLHLVYLDRFSYPWLELERYLKAQRPVESYFAEAEALGIEAAMHMEVDVAEDEIEDETRFVTRLDPRIAGAIAACRPESRNFASQFETLSAIAGVRGFRRILHTQPDGLSQTSVFRDNLRRLADGDFTFDLCLRADQLLPVGAPLVDQCNEVQFVLDHCGVPNIATGDFGAWRDAVSELARRPNLACKVSGIIAYAGPNPTAAALRPYVEHVIASFGWNRVVWGSDHPVCTRYANLTRWVEISREIVAGASDSEQRRLFADNARRLYRL